jgi:hypothetical protein
MCSVGRIDRASASEPRATWTYAATNYGKQQRATRRAANVVENLVADGCPTPLFTNG